MTDVESFERAFVAVSYLLGRRDALLDGLRDPSPAAKDAVRFAAEPSKAERARRLAQELVPVVAALNARGLK